MLDSDAQTDPRSWIPRTGICCYILALQVIYERGKQNSEVHSGGMDLPVQPFRCPCHFRDGALFGSRWTRSHRGHAA